MNTIKKISTFLSTMLLILFFSSCKYKQENKFAHDNADEIMIVYLTGSVETVSRIDCKSMANNNYYKKIIADTIRISHNDFSLIRDFLKSQKIRNDESSCDSRMYIKLDSFSVCIGDIYCACNLDGRVVDINLKTIYLIKCKSGYYNYFSKEQLLDDKSIIKFGIPKDYKYHRSAPNVRRKDCVKIIMIEKQNRN